METNTIWLWEEDYPSTLKANEFDNPILVLADFFRKYSLQEGRLLLREWLPYSFTQEMWYDEERRIRLFRFGRQLERLVDASWQFLHLQHRKKTYDIEHKISLTEAKTVAEGRTFYLLSRSEIIKPQRVLKHFFDYEELNRWKNLNLTDWYEALFDKNFCMNCNSNMLAEVTEYVNLNRLMTACFLLQNRTNETSGNDLSSMYPRNWCLTQKSLTEIIAWGLQYYTDSGLSNSLKCLASIYYFKRWHHEWHASSGAKLIKDYFEVYQLVHIAHQLMDFNLAEQDVKELVKDDLFQQIKSDKSIQDLLRALGILFKKRPIGIISRFLTSCIYTFSQGQQSSQDGQIQDLERLLKIQELVFKRIDQLINKNYK